MCGIAGFVARPAANHMPALRAMVERLAHRGPDDAGWWSDVAKGIHLGQRRLSILDLSAEGHQPMVSADGRYVLTYNGETYNHEELRARLAKQGHRFRGRSDTEVVLEAIAAWGLRETLNHMNAMFAFALWDRAAGRLHLARDRFGEKPLYYADLFGGVAFASEMRSFDALPWFRRELDPSAVALLLRHNCIPAPYAAHPQVRKLPPATVLTIDDGHVGTPMPYWSAAQEVHRAQAAPLQGGPEVTRPLLDALLRDAVRLRMVADVPLGAFLSGGIDSSTVVALMAAQSDAPVRTFTIGFREAAYDEAAAARAVANHLGTAHIERYVTPEEALAVVPRLPAIYDEPFADASQVPTFLVAELARRHVKVALSGDGGDEIFAGYNRYSWGASAWRRVRPIPRPLRRLAAAGIRALSPRSWDRLMGALGPILSPRLRTRLPGDKLHKLAGVLPSKDEDEFYLGLASRWKRPTEAVHGASEPATLLTGARPSPMPANLVERMMLLDTVTYLPDDILVKVDRATMAVGLEGRVPFLDSRVLSFAWRLPFDQRIRAGEGKWLLRQVLHQYVPPHLVERPKMGFGLPIGGWLRGPLRGWAEALLDERRLRREGLFDAAVVGRMWRQHLRGGRNWEHELWCVLMVQAWREHHGV